MKTLFTAICLLLTATCSLIMAQTSSNADKYHLLIKKAKGKIVLDGKVDEPDWQIAGAFGRLLR